jgi:actin-like ATPase involved in cell morphogenesis
MADIGIDLGTTNSVLAFLRGGPEVINIRGKPLLPSAVAYDDGEWLVGTAAKNLSASMRDVVTSPKRNMGTDKKYSLGGKTYTPVDMSAMILKEIKKHAEEFLGEPVTSAVITIPAHFNQQQVEDTRKAAEQAGLKVGKLLAEPVAASATYGSGGEETILVFDLGGGTLDCTVIDTFDAKILGLSGDNWLGGDDFDRRIVDRMVKHLKENSGTDVSGDQAALLQLKAKAELAKINLSEMNSTQVEFVGKLGGKLCQVDFRLTRKEYNAMIEDLVAKALEKADEAVQRASLRKDDIDVILLVGGSTLTPYVQERLAQHFGKQPSKRADPMLAVGLGAAVCTRDLPWDDKTHRVILRSRAEVWPLTAYTVRGRTSAGSRIEIQGAARPADAAANVEGQFATEVELNANAVNDLTVVATAPGGASARAMQRIRQDPQAEKAAEPPPEPIIEATLPRNFLVGMKEDRVAMIVKAGTSLPTSGETDQFYCDANPSAFTLQVPVYEGHMPEHEIPFGPLNTYMGLLTVSCPPTPSPTPLVLAFEVDDSRDIAVKCWFKHDPSVCGEVKLKGQAISRDKMHVIERTEMAVNSLGERLRPDEKAKINRKKQALFDLCEQYTGEPSEDVRKRIIETGNELREELKALEQKHKL